VGPVGSITGTSPGGSWWQCLGTSGEAGEILLVGPTGPNLHVWTSWVNDPVCLPRIIEG